MAQLNRAFLQTGPTEGSRSRSRDERERKVAFVSNGEQRRVSLRAPKPVRRDGRWLVPLIDLWVASLLPGDFLDLRFEIVTAGSGGAVRCSTPLDPLVFARGFVDVARRELWWSDPADSPLHGLLLVSVVALPSDTSDTSDTSVPDSAPTRESVPAPSAVVQSLGPGRVTESARVTESVAPRSDLRQLLPHAAAGYPAVEWRSAHAVRQAPAPTTSQPLFR